MNRRRSWFTPLRWLEYLLAILVGNAVYFLWLAPRAPAWLVHEPYRIDAGLALDFVLCAAIYGAVRWVASSWTRE